MQLAPQPSKSVFRLSNGHSSDEPVFFWRPYSNLPARHVLGSLTDGDTRHRPRHAHALFLGCTDPRNIIKSLAELRLGKDSWQLQLTAVLNDVHVPILARTALLLLMAAELDPNSKNDMRLLYDVWFNTSWHADTWPRFAAFTQRLIDGSVPWLLPLRRQDQQQLQEVCRWWLDEKHPNRPTPAKLCATRSTFNKSNPVRVHSLYKQPMHFINLGTDKYPPGFRHAVKVLHSTDMNRVGGAFLNRNTMRVNYESTTPQPLHVEQARLALCAVLEASAQLIETGSVSWDGNRRELQGNASSAALNITFLEPGTGVWNVHPDQQPFTCWGIYTAKEVTTAMQRGLQPASAFTDVFITRMASFVQRFQSIAAFGTSVSSSNSGSKSQKPVALQVQLMCGEALGLCLNQLQAGPAVSGDAGQAVGVASAPAGGSTCSMTAPFPTFDIIDTGSLCDDVGLLPLLVAVTPRLSNHPAARLHTVPATWTLAAPRMDYYLQEQALGMPLTMTPTLLGLRLVADIHYGRPGAHRHLVLETAVFDPRELAWAPVPPSQPQPRLVLPDLTTTGTDKHAYKDVQWGPAGSVGAVLQNVCKLCCTNNHQTHPHKYADIAVNLSTPHTFAWMLAACIPRLDMSSLMAEQESSVSSNQDECFRDAAAAHRALWALRNRVSALLPPHFRLAFQGAIDAVRASLQAATGSAAAEAAGVPACNQQSFLMLPITELEHGELAVAAGVRLRRPFVRALLGAHSETISYTLKEERITRDQVGALPMHGLKLVGRHPDFVSEFAFEGSPLDPPPEKWALTEAYLGFKPDKGAPLKVHVLDCCSVPYSKASGWRAAFMIPSDYASMQLPKETSMLVSVGLDYYSTHRAQKHKFMDIPIQAVSPVLAQCLLSPLLNPPTTQTATEGSKCSSALQVVQLDETVWGYEVVLKLQGPGTPSGFGIALPQAATDTTPPSYTGSDMPAPLLCSSTHIFMVRFTQPAEIIAQLVLGWPVAAGLGEPEGVMDNAYSSGCGVTAKLKKSEGMVELKLVKAQVWERWPEDDVPPLIACKTFASKDVRKTTQYFTQQFMYAHAGSYDTPSDCTVASLASHTRNPRNPLRSFIVQLLTCDATQPYKRFELCDESLRGKVSCMSSRNYHLILARPVPKCMELVRGSNAIMTLALHASGHSRHGVYIVVTIGCSKPGCLNAVILMGEYLQVDTADGQHVVAPALVVDIRFATVTYALQPPGFDATRYMNGISKIMKACEEMDPSPPDERTGFDDSLHVLNIIRRYLWHNAQRWQPNKWQQKLLSHVDVPAGPAGPYVMPCYATVITPLFVEHLQQFHHCDKVFNELLPAGIPHMGWPLPYPAAKPAAAKSKAGRSNVSAGPSVPAQTTPVPKAAGPPRSRGRAGTSSSSQKQQGVTSMDHESWVCEKISELRVDFSDCTDEELRNMAEMAYSMYAGSGAS